MIQIIWTTEKKEQAINLLTKYFERHGSGESIAQGDSAQFEAIELMCNIADEVLIDGEGLIYNPE